MSPSPALTTHATAPPVTDSPQPSQSPLTLSQHVQSPLHQQQPLPAPQQQQSQTPSRSCTPSHPPLFIIHNQIAESPQATAQAQPQQTHIQVQLQPPQPQQRPPPPQAATYQQEMPPVSQSPKPPPPPAPPAQQHQFSAPSVSTPPAAAIKAPVPIQGLTAEQQHHLQIVAAQIQTLSGISQPSPQQKQLLDKLHQVGCITWLQYRNAYIFKLKMLSSGLFFFFLCINI